MLSLAMIVEHAPTVPFLPASVRHDARTPGAHEHSSLRTYIGWEDGGATCEYGGVYAPHGGGTRTASGRASEHRPRPSSQKGRREKFTRKAPTWEPAKSKAGSQVPSAGFHLAAKPSDAGFVLVAAAKVALETTPLERLERH